MPSASSLPRSRALSWARANPTHPAAVRLRSLALALARAYTTHDLRLIRSLIPALYSATSDVLSLIPPPLSSSLSQEPRP